jgi:hypothetical protein
LKTYPSPSKESETIDREDEVVILNAEIDRLRSGLEKIAEYGKRNSGHGFSCSKMAQEILDEKKESPQ